MACPKGNPKISLGVLTPYVTIINFITTRWLVPKGASARLPVPEILAWLRLCWRRANRSIRWTFGKNNDLHYCHQVVKVINRIHQVDEHGETALIIASCLGKTEVLSLPITIIITTIIITKCLKRSRHRSVNQLIKCNKGQSSRFPVPKWKSSSSKFWHWKRGGRVKNTLIKTSLSDVWI